MLVVEASNLRNRRNKPEERERRKRRGKKGDFPGRRISWDRHGGLWAAHAAMVGGRNVDWIMYQMQMSSYCPVPAACSIHLSASLKIPLMRDEICIRSHFEYVAVHHRRSNRAPLLSFSFFFFPRTRRQKKKRRRRRRRSCRDSRSSCRFLRPFISSLLLCQVEVTICWKEQVPSSMLFESWNSYHPLESRIRPTILLPSEVANVFVVCDLKQTAKSHEISVIKPRVIPCRRDVDVVFRRGPRDANERSADRRRPISWSRVSFRRTTSATIYFANLCRPRLPTSLGCTSRKQFTS